MPDLILPSKLVGEKIDVEFDFRDELAWGEAIQGWACAVEVFTGDDSSPELLMAGAARKAGSTVRQRFSRGVPGVIYNLRCDVVGSTGAAYSKVAKLAILPDNALKPPIFADFFTTRPYPVEASDSIVTQISVLSGKMTWTVFTDDLAAARLQVLEGYLWGDLVEHDQPPEDYLTGTLTVLSGDLWGGLVEVIIEPESFQAVQLEVISGDIWGSYISYTQPPEDFLQVNLQVISGSLF